MEKIYSPAVYGPVVSRRLGYSLGINLLPLTKKICSFDCVYCECGKTENNAYCNHHFIKPSLLKLEIEKCFQWHANNNTTIDYVSFVGNGEPTMYPWFDEAVDIVLEANKKYLSQKPTAIFTNGTFLNRNHIVDSLYKIKRRFIKLDVSDSITFKKINRDNLRLSFDELIFNILKLKIIEISTAIIDGFINNIESIMSTKYTNMINNINPEKVFIYPIDRPSAYSNIVTKSEISLIEIYNYLDIRISSEVIILKPKMNRPSWFQEGYEGLVNIKPSVVYQTIEE